jgi:hypothetical protein
MASCLGLALLLTACLQYLLEIQSVQKFGIFVFCGILPKYVNGAQMILFMFVDCCHPRFFIGLRLFSYAKLLLEGGSDPQLLAFFKNGIKRF